MSKRKTNEGDDQPKRLRIVATGNATTRATGLAFRISNISSHVTESQVLDSLASLDGQLGQQNVLGWSFAPSAASADAERYRTATVTFKSVPTEFQIPTSSGFVDLIADTPPVIIDTHFYGLTPLNSGEQPTVE